MPERFLTYSRASSFSVISALNVFNELNRKCGLICERRLKSCALISSFSSLSAFIANSSLINSQFKKCNLRGAFLFQSNFWTSNFIRADLSNSFILNSCLTSACFQEAIIDGILIFGCSIDQWDIENIRCTHFFLPSKELIETIEPIILYEDGKVRGKRIPDKGYLSSGQFEDYFTKDNPNDEWLRVTEVAELLVVDKGTVSRWVDEGRIKGNGKK